jgi:Sulfotransferase family
MTAPAAGPGVRCESPIFIIGTERSGSNVLRLILNAHSRIAVPHPPHLMRYLAPLPAAHGDLATERDRRRLARDALTLLRRHIYPWEYPIDEDLVVAEAGPSLFGVVSAIYEQYRRAAGKARWGCKSTFMVDHVATVLAEYPRARFVWLVRDPRDVAASARRSVFGHGHPYLTARLWAAQQDRARSAAARWGPAVVHPLRYEDLVGRLDDEVARLCAFLGEPVEERMLRHADTPAAQRLAGLSASWRQVSQPVSARSVGRYREALTPPERALVEQVAGAQMTDLGYPVEPGSPPVQPPPALLLHARNAALRLRVEAHSLRRDRNHWRRWGRELTVRWWRLRAGWRFARPAPNSMVEGV